MNNEKTSRRYAYALPSELSGRQGQPGKFVGSFDSRATAELKARQNADDLVKVWTGEIAQPHQHFSELVNFQETIDLAASRHAELSEGTEESLDALHRWKLGVQTVSDEPKLRRRLQQVVDDWATEYLIHPTIPVLLHVQEGHLAHPYEPHSFFQTNLRFADMRYGGETYVENELHYRVLHNRADRFSRRPSMRDYSNRRVSERVPKIHQALYQWDARLPLQILTVYENRICLLKRALRSPWTKEHGIDYPRIQRELHWLRWRTTQIYQARCRSKEQRRRDYQAAQQPSISEIPSST